MVTSGPCSPNSPAAYILPPSCASLLSSLPLRFLLHAFFKSLAENSPCTHFCSIALNIEVVEHAKSSELAEVLISTLSHEVKSNHHFMCKRLEHTQF